MEFWLYRSPPAESPPMYWYGWIVLAAASAFVLGLIATVVPGQWLRRATVFCCALAALWPTSLGALRLFIDWVSFNADYLNSVWVAAIPALVGAAAISYFVPSQWVQRTWTSWLLIVPIGGLIVLGYSLQQYFVRLAIDERHPFRRCRRIISTPRMWRSADAASAHAVFAARGARCAFSRVGSCVRLGQRSHPP